MASTQEILAQESYRCYHCGLESENNSFKYFDNKKADQPRYQCHHCRKFFTLGSHGRPQGKTYAKKRNEDPAELKSLSRQCRHCGVADHALFKYYNNNNLSQPRFKCLSCGKQFQMRLLGTGEERRLVHTSSTMQTRAPRRRKQTGVSEPLQTASSSSEDGIYQPFVDGSFMRVPADPLMPMEPGARLVSEMSDEDVQFSDFLEAELAAEEEKTEAHFICSTSSGDDGNLLPPPLSDEAPDDMHFLGAEFLTDENNEAQNIDAFSYTAAIVDGGWAPTWSHEDAVLTDFNNACVSDNEAPTVDMVSDDMGEMFPESTSNNAEVMYGTMVVESLVTSDSDSWSHSDTSVDPTIMSYADAAAACCRQMDMEMAEVAPMQPIGSECSSSSVGSTITFADPFHVIPEPDLFQQDWTEDEQCSDFPWNDDDEAEVDTERAVLG